LLALVPGMVLEILGTDTILPDALYFYGIGGTMFLAAIATYGQALIRALKERRVAGQVTRGLLACIATHSASQLGAGLTLLILVPHFVGREFWPWPKPILNALVWAALVQWMGLLGLGIWSLAPKGRGLAALVAICAVVMVVPALACAAWWGWLGPLFAQGIRPSPGPEFRWAILPYCQMAWCLLAWTLMQVLSLVGWAKAKRGKAGPPWALVLTVLPPVAGAFVGLCLLVLVGFAFLFSLIAPAF
jgi:hypothetical protein